MLKMSLSVKTASGLFRSADSLSGCVKDKFAFNIKHRGSMSSIFLRLPGSR
jgi:hypothetical protein